MARLVPGLVTRLVTRAWARLVTLACLTHKFGEAPCRAKLWTPPATHASCVQGACPLDLANLFDEHRANCNAALLFDMSQTEDIQCI